MKIVIAPDSFKGTMSSQEVCEVVSSAIKIIAADVETVKIPVADGGEGLVDVILYSKGGRKISKTVKGPNFKEVEAFYGILDDEKTAIIEMASASGIIVAGKRLNPWNTTTYGTGQLIIDAIDNGCDKLILGIGGSATNDAGVGMAAAFGVRFLDMNGDEIPLTGGGIEKLKTIDYSNIDKRLKQTEILVACDVDNPLYGKNGAAYTFSPQKGADDEMVEKLDKNMKKFAGLLYQFTGRKFDDIPGTGAAGGIATCLLAFTKSTLKRGIDIVLDCVEFDNEIANADYVITGEGKIDSQTLRGKVVIGIAKRAASKNVPVIVVAGSVDKIDDDFYKEGISAIFSSTKLTESFDEMKPKCKEYLSDTVENIIRLILLAKEVNFK